METPTNTIDTRLKEAAQVGDINVLYALIKEDPKVLERIDEIPFVDTPLHKAAAAGCTYFALEVLGLKPSFGRKLNPDGFSPLHLALQNGHTETAKRLVKVDGELVRVQGKERFTPLHYVAQTDEIDVLAEFLVACPGSIQDLTNRCESAVHLAAKKGKIPALEVLVGWLNRTDPEVLNWKDEEGNTVLHIAALHPEEEDNSVSDFEASTNQPQASPPTAYNQSKVMRLVITDGNKSERNFAGLTPLDILGDPTPANVEAWRFLRDKEARRASSLPEVANLAKFLRSPQGYLSTQVLPAVYRQMLLPLEVRSALLVVAVLIVATTYQGVLSPPGGFKEGDDSRTSIQNEVTSTAADAPLLGGFLFLNSAAFFASTMVIAVILHSLQYKGMLLGSMNWLSFSYFSAVLVMTGNGSVTPLTFSVVFIMVLLFSVVFLSFEYVLRREKVFAATKSIDS